jgi:hypothetical protein
MHKNTNETKGDVWLEYQSCKSIKPPLQSTVNAWPKPSEHLDPRQTQTHKIARGRTATTPPWQKKNPSMKPRARQRRSSSSHHHCTHHPCRTAAAPLSLGRSHESWQEWRPENNGRGRSVGARSVTDFYRDPSETYVPAACRLLRPSARVCRRPAHDTRASASRAPPDFPRISRRPYDRARRCLCMPISHGR